MALSHEYSSLFTTAAGLRRFHARIDRARAEYDAVVATNGDAAEAGDNSVWHDNFAYEENQRQMHQLARRVRDLELEGHRLVVVEPPRAPSRVTIGVAVIVEDDAGRTERFVIGGHEDSDPTLERIACGAPLALALTGAEVGECRVVRVSGRERELTVVSVEPARPEEL